MQTTDKIQNGNPNFIQTGEIVTFHTEARTGYQNWRTVGRPVEPGTAQAWDGVDPSFDKSISSRVEGAVSYAKVEITGRKIRRFAGDLYGVAAVIRWADGGESPAVIPMHDKAAQAAINEGRVRW